jgi:hypothetical protein
MPSFVLLTRLAREAIRNPQALERLEREAMQPIREETLIRIHGHAHTETWAAVEWDRFKELVHELSGDWTPQPARPA